MAPSQIALTTVMLPGNQEIRNKIISAICDGAMLGRQLGALGDPGDIAGVCSTTAFLYRPGRSEDLRVVFGRSDLVHKLALALLFGTDGVEDSLAVLALRNVKFAGRLAVSGQNLGLVAAGLAATGEAGGLAH